MIAVQESDNLMIEEAYQQLLHTFKKELDEEDRQNIEAAYLMAVEAHSPQRRKSGEPYVLHPIEVARICVEEIGLGPTAVVCALLHDVVEDTPITLEEIEEKFSPKIASIVDGLTKLDSAYNSESPQADNFKKVLSTLTTDVRVVLIKMADRIHNLRTIGAMPRHKQLKIAAETTFIYAPLAHRLGLYNFKTEFQDLCMKITDRETYSNIAKKLQETKKARNAYIDSFIEPLKIKLDESDIPYRIVGRPKSIYSIWNKLKTKKVPFEEIYDLFAVRIIVDVPIGREKAVCWQIYSMVTDVYRPIAERLKDWVSNPKSNGYESLHTTVIGLDGRFVEVQIRSERMDDIAERGFAAHWKYKGVSKSPNVYDYWLDNIRHTLDSHSGQDAIDFLYDFKTHLFTEEVFVYTPKGDVKMLPKGATALDFAFAIHTDVGEHCTAIKINNKLVPMGYKLQNGDKIEVTTRENQKPNESWLKLVTTSRARSKIRSALKEEQKKQGAFGKEALERKFKNLKIDFSESNIETLVKYVKLKSHTDFYFGIATEKIDINDLLKNFDIEHGKLVVIKEVVPTTVKEDLENIRTKPSTASKIGILINGEPAENYKFQLASCCNPVNGDDIFGYVSKTGLKIHRANCPNSMNLMARYGNRVLKAEWSSVANTNFVVNLVITGEDRGVGVIEMITNKISSKMGVNIRSFHIDGDEGYFEGKVKLQVRDKNQLYLVIKALKELDGISSVTRLE